MVEQTQNRMTAAEFLALPETNLPRQLLHGEVISMTAPELAHQDAVGNIFVLFKEASKTYGGKAYVAPVDVYLDDVNIPQPDVVWLAPDSRCQPLGGKSLSGPPDLIAEVLSPSTARIDKRVKFRLYEKYGVREYWLADPRDQLVEVWQYQDGHFVLLDAYGLGEMFTSALIGAVDTKAIFAG
jgi:Uma2 family endonuclease